MDKIRDVLVSLEANKYKIDDTAGTKPGVLFGDAGNEVVIFMKKMVDEFDVISFIFAEGLLDLDGNIIIRHERKVYAAARSWVDVATGQVVGASTALNEDGSLKEGYVTEYNFYVSIFGMSVNATSSIYQKVQGFISSRMSDGVLNYQTVS